MTMCCAKGDRTDRLFNFGRRTLIKELSVLRLVRSMRVIENFVDRKIPSRDKNQVIRETRRLVLDPTKLVIPEEKCKEYYSDSEEHVSSLTFENV